MSGTNGDASTAAMFDSPQSIGTVAHRDHVTVRGTVTRTEKVVIGGSPAFVAVLSDGTEEIDLLFIGRTAVPGFAPGAVCTARGTARIELDHLVIWNPLYRFEPADLPHRDRPQRGR